MSIQEGFDPNRARQIGPSGEVENINWAESRDAASVINSLNNLAEMGKGTSIEDFRKLAKFLHPKIVARLRDTTKHYYDNLEQLLSEQEGQK
jgi:hypothetical protein